MARDHLGDSLKYKTRRVVGHLGQGSGRHAVRRWRNGRERTSAASRSSILIGFEM